MERAKISKIQNYSVRKQTQLKCKLRWSIHTANCTYIFLYTYNCTYNQLKLSQDYNTICNKKLEKSLMGKLYAFNGQC